MNDSRNELLEGALWTARHLGPIIPTDPCGALNAKGQPSKEPCKHLVPHGSKEATTDEATIRRWWASEPCANIGFVGASASPAIYVIDVDVHDGVDGFANIAAAGYALPETLTAETPSGGRHYFYKHTTGDKPKQTQSNIRDANGEKIIGVDVRGVNGYVVIAPSRTVRGSYKWTNERFDDLAEFPEWAKRVGAQPKKPKAVGVTQPDLPPAPRADKREPPAPTELTEEMKLRIKRYLAKVPPAVEGKGGHGALLYACEKVAVGFNLDDAAAEAILWKEYNPLCVPPWTSEEWAKDIRHKLKEARTKSSHPFGYLLDARRTKTRTANTATPPPDEEEDVDAPEEATFDWNAYIEQLPGLVGDIARYALASMIRPQPKFAVLIALTTCSTVYNRTVRDSAGNIASLYSFAVCPNGGGKDKCLKLPPKLLDAAFDRLKFKALLFMSKAHSESAIADALSCSPVTTMLVDEVAGFFMQMRAAAGNGSSIGTVKEALKNLYSVKHGDDYEGAKNARHQGRSIARIRVNTPCLSFVGVSQDDVLPEAFAENDVRNGFLPRCIFFVAEERPKKNYSVLANPPPIPEKITGAIHDALFYQKWINPNPMQPQEKAHSHLFDSFEIKATKEAADIQRSYGEFCDERVEKLDEEGKLTSSIWVRADENARRVALILAAGRGYGKPWESKIETGDVMLATALVSRCASDACRFLEGRIMDDRFDQLKGRIRRFVAKAGAAGRTLTEITRGKFGDPRVREAAIQDEIDAGYVRRGSACRNGRTAEAFFITRKGRSAVG